MNKHFDFLIEDTIVVECRKLTRIRALIDLPNHGVKAGDLGGYIEKADNLFDTAWVSDNACVFDDACVYNNARVSDNACVYNNARVYNNACVYNNARVYNNASVSDNACVYNNARVSDNACVYNNARVYHNARVFDDACVYHNARVSDDGCVSDNACVYNNARVSDNACVYNNARVSDNACVYNNARVSSNACVSGHGAIKTNADFIIVGPAISSDRYTTAYRTTDQSIHVTTGCFTGSIQEFEEAINKSHADNQAHKQQYMKFVQLIKLNFDVYLSSTDGNKVLQVQ